MTTNQFRESCWETGYAGTPQKKRRKAQSVWQTFVAIFVGKVERESDGTGISFK